jgi:hypothetical protein
MMEYAVATGVVLGASALTGLHDKSKKKKQIKDYLGQLDSILAEEKNKINSIYQQRTAEIKEFKQDLIRFEEASQGRLLELEQEASAIRQWRQTMRTLLRNIAECLMPDNSRTIDSYLHSLSENDFLSFLDRGAFINYFIRLAHQSGRVEEFLVAVNQEVSQRSSEAVRQNWGTIRLGYGQIDMFLRRHTDQERNSNLIEEPAAVQMGM